MKNERKRMMVALAIVIEIFSILFIWRRYHVDNLFYRAISGKELVMVSEIIGAYYDENGINAFSPTQTKLEDAEILSCGPYISLPRGSYDIIFHYVTDTDGNYFKMYCGNSRYLDALYANDKDGYFPASETELVCSIRALSDIEAFDIQTMYQGVGKLTIEKIVIQQTNADVVFYVIRWIVCLLILNALILIYHRIQWIFARENYKYTMAIIALIVFSSILLFVNGYYSGHDSVFHFMRIEGLKEAILSGQFPAKIHPTHLKGYGYATGTMYPELFLYLPAVLRIFCVDIIDAYKIFILFINLLTVGITFYSFKGIFEDKQLALAGTVMYVLAPYRILDLYYRAAIGEACALMGLPLIAYGLYTFVRAGKDCDKKPKWLALTIGYSIIIETHIISILIVAIFSVLVCAVCVKTLINKKCIVAFCKMFVAVVGINLWFIVPFLDYYRLPFNQASDSMNQYGITFAQLFTNKVLADFPMHSLPVEQGIKGEVPFGMGYSIIIAVTLFILFLRENKKYFQLGKVCFGIGSIAIVFSLYQFPWDEIVQHISILSFLSNIQFPWRFLEITLVGFVICGCIGLENISSKIKKTAIILGICILSIYTFCQMTDPYLEKADMGTYVSLDTTDVGTLGEYLIEGTDKFDLLENGEKLVTSSDTVSFHSYKKQGTNMNLIVDSLSDSEQYIEVPVLLYPGYQVVDELSGEKLAVTYGNNNVARIMIPANYHGAIKMFFDGKWYWKLAMIISYLSIISIIGLEIWEKKSIKEK